MAYLCKECGHRTMTSGNMGECPACGGYDLVKRDLVLKEKELPKKWRLVLLVGLWSYLLVLIIRKLFL